MHLILKKAKIKQYSIYISLPLYVNKLSFYHCLVAIDELCLMIVCKIIEKDCQVNPYIMSCQSLVSEKNSYLNEVFISKVCMFLLVYHKK